MTKFTPKNGKVAMDALLDSKSFWMGVAWANIIMNLGWSIAAVWSWL